MPLWVERACELMFERSLRTVAHATGTPLNVISARAELLGEDLDATEAGPALASIIEKCEQISASIRRPLDALQQARRPTPTVDLASLLLGHEVDGAEAAMGQVMVCAEDGPLALFALTMLCQRLGTPHVRFQVEARPQRVELYVSLDSPHGIATGDDLAEPWKLEGLARGAWTAGILVHALASANGAPPRVAPARLGLGLKAR